MFLLGRIWRPLCRRHSLYGLISMGDPRMSLSVLACPKNKINLQIPTISTAGHSLLSVSYQIDCTRYFCQQFCPLSAWDRMYLLSRTGQFGLIHSQRCFRSTLHSRRRQQNRSALLYVISAVILVIGFSYAAVPLYTLFCQATGLGGEVQVGHDTGKVETMTRVASRPIKVRFNADLAASMRWNFRPQQTEITVYPGETALAFYSAINPTDKPIIGISTYNVVPFDAGQYFNKIQCFCFEEQRLNPHEQVDMPVFFFIDPEFAEDPKMGKVDSIVLSYTFFEAKEGLVLPDPFAKP